jgi:hypothetical protein
MASQTEIADAFGGRVALRLESGSGDSRKIQIAGRLSLAPLARASGLNRRTTAGTRQCADYNLQ